eukprot:361840-Chlamydomonas_euryale.AAC.18
MGVFATAFMAFLSRLSAGGLPGIPSIAILQLQSCPRLAADHPTWVERLRSLLIARICPGCRVVSAVAIRLFTHAWHMCVPAQVRKGQAAF